MNEYINLYHLSYFLEVANQRSLSRAAEKLNISQPALSKCIKIMQEKVGVKLYSYSNHVFSLTTAGEQFANAIRVFLQQYDNMINAVQSESAFFSGTVKIGIPAAILDAVFLDAARVFISKNSGISLSVVDEDSSMILDGLAKGEIDIGIIMLSSTLPSNVEIHPLLQDICYVVLNKSDPLTSEETISLSQLSGKRFLMAGELSSLYITFNRMCEHIGVKPNIIYQGMNPRFFMSMISQEQCVTVFPKVFVDLYKTDNIVLRPLEPPLEWNIALLTRADRRLSSQAMYVRDYLVDYYAGRV